MLKASENPPIAWPAGRDIRDAEGQWWVVHTRSRNEKALAWELVRHDISYFLPMRWKVSRMSGRTVRSFVPLFTGYLFFCGTEEQRIAVLQTNRAAGLISVKDQERLVGELSQIELALRGGAALQPDKYVKEGQWCRVSGGPLAGLKGIVLKAGGRARLLLQVDMLGQATSVEIDHDLIEKLEEDRQ
ncbi:MAG TPA: transcription termination/antitermination NusG family protein [Sedimentisphaerales bacterium]|nr:transcription termination/antitermination NusG family protein [Sedimentisphaerales bacterium]